MEIYVVVSIDATRHYPSGEGKILYVGSNKELAHYALMTEYEREGSNVITEVWESGKRIRQVSVYNGVISDES